MKDETYLFISDVKEKKITARSARHTRTHCGKGGRVRFPSDNLSKKELEKMNGECKSFRLNDPMGWAEFMSMPDDLKITYIKLLKNKFGCSATALSGMLGVSVSTAAKEFKKLGIDFGKPSGRRKWDKEGFLAWWHGVDALPTPVPEEEPTQEEKKQIFFGGTENLPEEKIHWVEPESYAEDDLPYEEPDPIHVDDFTKFKVVPEVATPINGSMQLKCPADQALNTLAQLLGNTNCAISVMWRVIEEGGAEE